MKVHDVSLRSHCVPPKRPTRPRENRRDPYFHRIVIQDANSFN
jgi:hypothetical protein